MKFHYDPSTLLNFQRATRYILDLIPNKSKDIESASSSFILASKFLSPQFFFGLQLSC